MKWLFVPIFMMLVLCQAFSKWIMLAEYNIWKDYITEHLCENRYRPSLHCNGKCVLMKKMAAEESQSSNGGMIKLNWESFLFIDDHAQYVQSLPAALSDLLIASHSDLLKTYFTAGVFRPPLV